MSQAIKTLKVRVKDKHASVLRRMARDGEADKDELHDALAARAAKEGAQHG